MNTNQYYIAEMTKEGIAYYPVSMPQEVATSIAQAIAEERKRVVELIKESKKGYAGTQYRYGKEALDDLLTSLDITNKDI